MSATNLPMLAGMVSTALFVTSYMPMLAKAYRTRDLRSYSRGNLMLTTVGNVVHSVYVYSLPAGPLWILHTFYLVATVLMLIWHQTYAERDEVPVQIEDRELVPVSSPQSVR